MSSNKRSLDHNLLAHNLQRISRSINRIAVLRAWFAVLSAARRRRNRRNIRNRAHRLRIKLQNRIANHIIRRRLLRKRNHNAFPPDNSRLLPSNLRDSIPQKLLVIERDVGNHAEPRLDDVGCIQTTSHSDFQNRNVNRDAGEVLKGNRRKHLEEARMPRQIAIRNQPLRSAIDQIMQTGKVIIQDRLAIHPNALVDPHQMRRSVKPSPQSGSPQNRGQSRRRRAFPVGPSNQNTRKPSLRMVQSCQQHAHVFQIELVRRCIRQFVSERVHARNGSFVRH